MLPHLQRSVQLRKPDYTYGSHHVVVDLQKTKLERLLHPATSPRPQPDMGCEECLALQLVQAFAITALVHTVSAPRSVKQPGRTVRDAAIYNGSKTPHRGAETLVEAVVMPTLQVFSGPQGAAMMEKLEAAAGRAIPSHALACKPKWRRVAGQRPP